MAQKLNKQVVVPEELSELVWHSAAYTFHSYAYRDPRSAFASGIGVPIVSPTTVLLGIVSTLFSIGDADAAARLLATAHQCEVIVDAPNGVVFYRAFHQLRRYRTMKWGNDPRYGFTTINQGTREYGLVDGAMTLYVGAPEEHSGAIEAGLLNLRHLGTSDSLCSLVASVEQCDKPERILYLPIGEVSQANHSQVATIVTLSRFIRTRPILQTMPHWKMTGDTNDTELVPFVIPGGFQGTTRGRVYRKQA
jgi:hypothetical protein